MRYSILVNAEIEAEALVPFGDLSARSGGGRTELVGDIVDQSQLLGVIGRLNSMRLEVLHVAPVDGALSRERR